MASLKIKKGDHVIVLAGRDKGKHGEVVSVSKIRRPAPVEEYLRLQRRFAHLFGDPPRTDVIERLQAIADRNIRRFGLLEEEAAA